MTFNLDSLALADTFSLQLRHPVTGELLFADKEKEKAVTIEIYGTSSKQYRNATSALQNRQLKRRAKKEKESAEVFKEESLTLLLACSAGATNLSYENKPVGDEASFRKLYADAKFSWLKDQVDEAIGDVANFLAQ